ncbi:hypothetical protein BGZ98_003181 [Dissophora globulifera]|nr:hypothetical protein BGZ98_003181 [Dissophora globulifera]
MESKLSWISERTVFDVESFAKQFDYETEGSTAHDIQELTKNTRIPQITRKAIQRSLEHWLAVDHGTFWEDQKKCVAAKKALSNAQTAIIGKASDLVPGTLDQVVKPKQKKDSGTSLSSSQSAAAPPLASVLSTVSTTDDDTTTDVDTDSEDGSEKTVEMEDDSPLELSRSKAYEDALRLFKGSPLLPFFRYIFQKAQGCTDAVPQMPTDIPSTNLKRLVAYARRVLTGNDTLHDVKDVYLITQIASQVTLKELTLPTLAKILSPLQESFARNDFSLNFLQQEVELRLAELVLCERDGNWVTKEEKADLVVSRQVYQILHFFCVVIGSGQFENKNSETECVAYWSHVWRILFARTCIIVNTGEIASVATKEDMHINELLFGTVTQSGGRKTDTLVLAKEVSGGEVQFIECSVNEHKPLHAGLAALREQSRKLVRINRSILSCTGSKKTVLFIDAHGLCGKIYGMRAIEDVYGVSAVLGKICLPSNEFEMSEFLSGSSLGTLFRYKTHMVGFGEDVLQKRAHSKVQTPPNSPSLRPTTPSLFTPTKKRTGSASVVPQTAPVSPSLRPASRRRMA